MKYEGLVVKKGIYPWQEKEKKKEAVPAAEAAETVSSEDKGEN